MNTQQSYVHNALLPMYWFNKLFGAMPVHMDLGKKQSLFDPLGSLLTCLFVVFYSTMYNGHLHSKLLLADGEIRDFSSGINLPTMENALLRHRKSIIRSYFLCLDLTQVCLLVSFVNMMHLDKFIKSASLLFNDSLLYIFDGKLMQKQLLYLSCRSFLELILYTSVPLAAGMCSIRDMFFWVSTLGILCGSDAQFAIPCEILKIAFRMINTTIKSVDSKNNESCVLLRTTCKYHSLTCDLIDQLNLMTRSQIFLTITVNFMLLVSSSFFVIVSTSDGSHEEAEKKQLIREIVWVVTVIMRQTSTCWRGSDLIKEARRSHDLITQLLIHPVDMRIKDQIRIFLCRLKSRKTQFTIFGFFNLDMILLMAYILATVTYLMVFLKATF